MKFKVGDKVKEITMEKTGIIKRTYGLTCAVEFEDDGHWTVDKRLLELVEEEHMTYKEFEEIVSEWDMYIEDEFVIKKLVGIVAEFCESKVGYINTYFTTFNQLEGNTKKIFLQALVKLSLTPIDKREEVKELTVDEISELLGYKVKIKGEK